MKKSILFMLFIALFAFELSAQKKPKRTTANEQKIVKIAADKPTPANARSSRYEIFDKTIQVYRGKYLNIYHEKDQIYNDYKYEVEVYVNDGKVATSIYGDRRYIRDANGSGYKQETYYQKHDLRSHEGSIVIGIYGYQDSRVRVKIWKVKNHNDCQYNDPTYDLTWLKDMKRDHPDRKICEYEIHGKKYFQIFKCGVSHYTEYWYDCYGREICKFENGRTCNEVRDAHFIKCWYTPNHCNDNQHCDYNDPTYDLSWLKDMKRDYPDRKICEYEFNGNKYFQIFKCGVSHYTEYWYDCYGYKVCEFQNGQTCHEVKDAKFIKCWYTPNHCGEQCDYRFWYDDCDDHKEIQAGKGYYVKVNAEKYHNIKWMELYIDGKKIRRESNYPYEWGKPGTNGDHELRNMRKGTYKLKCVVYDKCGDYREEYCTIIVKDRRYCEKEVWYEKGKHNTHYRKHSNVYVRVAARKHQDIEWCELYVGDKKVRREVNAPYEWGKPHSNNDHLLNNMSPGTYRLKCKYKTKCGKYYEKYSTIHIDH